VAYVDVLYSRPSVLERVGEIESRALFDSFEQHALETGEYPIRQFYHPGRGFSHRLRLIFVARYGYCYVTSGPYDDTPSSVRAEVKARLAELNFGVIALFYAGRLNRS